MSILLQIETCSDMCVVNSDIMAHRLERINIIINFCNAKKKNCALMIIISNHYGRKYLSILLC